MKKLFKKIVTMGIAAVMAVSAMSLSAFAEENVDEENIDFYNTVHILTFNMQTGIFDSTYETTESVRVITPFTLDGYTFHFNQTINTNGSFLKNLDDGYDSYAITDDDTMVFRLDNKPSQEIKMNLCRNSGVVWGDSITINTSQTYLKLNGLSDYFSSFGSLKIKMTATSKSETISGSISEF